MEARLFSAARSRQLVKHEASSNVNYTYMLIDTASTSGYLTVV